MAKKKELGKGIRALLSGIESEQEVSSTKTSKGSEEISIKKIETNPFQPRREFDANLLEELAESISTHGIIQPITVRSLGGDKYQIISGERRMRASKMTGLKTIPAYIREADDQGMLEMALIENVQRSDLNALEVAISYQRLIDECKLTHESLSKRIGKARSNITNYIRLLRLPPIIQSGIKTNSISMSHARCLVGIEDSVRQIDLYNQVIDRKLSVRELEKLSNARPPFQGEKASSTLSITPELFKIQDDLSHKLGLKTSIKRNNKGKGHVTIQFESDDALNDLIDHLLD